MNILERINRDRILIHARFKLSWNSEFNNVYPSSPVIFCDTGIGNVANMRDLINEFKRPVCVISTKAQQHLIETLYKHAEICDYDHIPDNDDSVVICNFLNQRKKQIKLILKHEFKHRIGHTGGKWEQIFNYPVSFDKYRDELKSNADLLKALKNEYYNVSHRDK